MFVSANDEAQLVDGSPSVLVERGKFIQENLNRERITPGEVFGEMHKSGLEQLSEVKWAILETDGKISIVPEHNGSDVKGSRPKEKSAV